MGGKKKGRFQIYDCGQVQTVTTIQGGGLRSACCVPAGPDVTGAPDTLRTRGMVELHFVLLLVAVLGNLGIGINRRTLNNNAIFE